MDFWNIIIVYFDILNNPPAFLKFLYPFALHSLNCSVLCAANPVN